MKTLTLIKLKTTFQKTMLTAGRRNVLRVWQGGGSNYRSEGNKKKACKHPGSCRPSEAATTALSPFHPPCSNVYAELGRQKTVSRFDLRRNLRKLTYSRWRQHRGGDDFHLERELRASGLPAAATDCGPASYRNRRGETWKLW